MKILVTGSTGLLGSAIRRIVKENPGDHEYHFTMSKETDLRDINLTGLLFDRFPPDIVIHTAAVVKSATSTEEEQFDSFIANTQMTTNIFECCKRHRVKRVLGVLSSVMISETDITPENINKGPSLDTKVHFGYSHSKRVLQAMAESYTRAGYGEVILFCPPNIYGAEDFLNGDRLIPSIYRQIIKDNDCQIKLPENLQRRVIWNMDFARIILEHCFTKNTEKLVIVGSPLITTKDIVDAMIKIFNPQRRGKVDMLPSVECKERMDQKYIHPYPYTNFQSSLLEIKKTISGTITLPLSREIGLGIFKETLEIKQNIADVLYSGRLSYGKYSQQFEKDFATMHDCKFAVLSNSGTSSLQVGLAAMKEYYKWSNGDEVIVPVITFVASVNTIIQNNLKPVLADVEMKYYGLDAEVLEKYITPRTKAIMVVHLFGQCCDMDSILKVAEKWNLRIIEDSCETMLCKYKGRSVGSFGDVGVFSTYVAHLVVTGVGGLSTTNNPELARLMRSLVNHGRNNIYISIDDDNNVGSDSRFKEIIDKRFKFERVGYSYRITELESAIGCAQLKGLAEQVRQRKRNARILSEGLSKWSEYLQLPEIREGGDHVFMMYPVVIKNDKVDKGKMLYALEKKGIETRDLMPITNQPVYRDTLMKDVDERAIYPVSSYLNSHGFYVGCHNLMTEDDMNYVVSVFDEILGSL